MFGLSEATEIFQGSTERTWNCVLHYIQLIWSKLSQFGKPIMPKSRKRHHSRSRSKSRSHSRDRSRDREDKYQKTDSYEKDRDGKRRKIDSSDSPHHRKSVSSDPECEALPISSDEEMEALQLKEDTMDSVVNDSTQNKTEESKCEAKDENTSNILTESRDMNVSVIGDGPNFSTMNDSKETSEKELIVSDDENNETEKTNLTIDLNESVSSENSTGTTSVKSNLEITPKKVLSPRHIRKQLESEKKRQEKQREKEEREKKRNEEKVKKMEEKQKELEQKQKEKELKEAQRKEEREKKEEQKRKEREEKEEQKRKEREEKEQKRKEKEEKEEQKRKEREMEKLKKQREIEDKKKKEEEKRQKAAANFVNFFVPKKSDNIQEKKSEDANPSAFMAFEIKSDMRLPPQRRKSLTDEEIENLDKELKAQNPYISYLAELKSSKNIRTSSKTWPYQETLDDDVIVVEDSLNLGECICEDNSKLQKFRAKFLKFRENRRPAYYGTWRKKSKFITGRKPFAEDSDMFNYEEDSDDDWEEEEQGESLNGSDDEEKETEEERDEYEVDNEFFVPHGHLSDDEIDDEEKTKLSPESLKQKLKLLKDEFEQDMQSKTHKLKSRSVGCIWYKKDGSNIEEVIDRYLQPFKVIASAPIQIKNRSEIFLITSRKNKQTELNPEYIPLFLKVIHGNPNKKTVLIEQFLTYMANKGIQIDLKKGTLIRLLKQFATWKQSKEKGSTKHKFLWLVDEDVEQKYNVNLVLPNFLETDGKK